jgi:hypothetical protein
MNIWDSPTLHINSNENSSNVCLFDSAYTWYMIMAWRKQAWHCIDPTMVNVHPTAIQTLLLFSFEFMCNVGESQMFMYIHILSYYNLCIYFNCETNQHYTKTQIKVIEQLVVRKDIDVNEHDRLYNITYRLKLK